MGEATEPLLGSFSGMPAAVTVDVSASGTAWGRAVRRACGADGVAVKSGIVCAAPVMGEAVVVACRGSASSCRGGAEPLWASGHAPGVYCFDECPLWQASRHAEGLPVDSLGSVWSEGASGARAMVSLGSWRHASKAWRGPDREAWRDLRNLLGLTVSPWRFSSDSSAPVVVVSRNPGGVWFGAGDPVRSWMAEDDRRMERAASVTGRPVVLRLHPRTPRGALLERTSAGTPPRCSIEEPGMALKESLRRAAVVETECGGTCVYAALCGVPALRPGEGSDRSQVPVQWFSARVPGEPVCGGDMPGEAELERSLSILAAHSLTPEDVAAGRLWRPGPDGEPS